VTRQGVRWRFQHIFGSAYIAAFETILAIEKIFGTQLREYAIKISREKHAIRQKNSRQIKKNDKIFQINLDFWPEGETGASKLPLIFIETNGFCNKSMEAVS